MKSIVVSVAYLDAGERKGEQTFEIVAADPTAESEEACAQLRQALRLLRTPARPEFKPESD